MKRLNIPRILQCAFFAACLLSAFALPAAQAVNVSGKWLFTLTMEDISVDYAADLETEGEQVRGTWAGTPVEGTFKEGELGLSFAFHPPEADRAGTLNVTGRFNGDGLAGNWSWNEYAGAFKAARRP